MFSEVIRLFNVGGFVVTCSIIMECILCLFQISSSFPWVTGA